LEIILVRVEQRSTALVHDRLRRSVGYKLVEFQIEFIISADLMTLNHRAPDSSPGAPIRRGPPEYGAAGFKRYSPLSPRGFGVAAFTRFASEGWWACLDSSQEPDRYKRLKPAVGWLKKSTIVAF